jgi:hypothetical protein
MACFRPLNPLSLSACPCDVGPINPPISFLFLECRYAQKLVYSSLRIVALQLLCIVVFIFDVDIAALLFVVVFVFEVVAELH